MNVFLLGYGLILSLSLGWLLITTIRKFIYTKNFFPLLIEKGEIKLANKQLKNDELNDIKKYNYLTLIGWLTFLIGLAGILLLINTSSYKKMALCSMIGFIGLCMTQCRNQMKINYVARELLLKTSKDNVNYLYQLTENQSKSFKSILIQKRNAMILSGVIFLVLFLLYLWIAWSVDRS